MCNVGPYEEKWSLGVFSINLVDKSKVTCICDTKVSRGGKVAKYFNNLIPLSIGRVGKLCGQT